MLKLLPLILVVSCASITRQHSTEPPLHDTQAVLDLGRSAYLKGCVDGVGALVPQYKKSKFEDCKNLALKYEQDLKTILD